MKNSKKPSEKIKARPFRDLPRVDKITIPAALFVIALGVYEQVSNEMSTVDKLQKTEIAQISDDLVEVIVKEVTGEDEKDDEEDKDEKAEKKIEVIEDVSEFLDDDGGDDVLLESPEPLDPEQVAQVNELKEGLRAYFEAGADIPYHDFAMRLMEIVHNLDAEQIANAYGEFIQRNYDLEKYSGDIHEYVHEVRNTQGRYDPNLRSLMTILLGKGFDEEDPAGNCVARGENDFLHLLTQIPEERIYVQKFNKMIDPQGSLKNVGHVRIIYEVDGKFYNTEAPGEVDVNEKGFVMYPLKEAVKEFAGLGRAKPANYVPYYDKEEEKFADIRGTESKGNMRSLIGIDSGDYSLMPYYGSIEEQKHQPASKPFRGVKTVEQQQREKERIIPATVFPVPEELAIEEELITLEVITELVNKFRDAEKQEDKDKYLLELAIRTVLAKLSHKKFRSSAFHQNGQSLKIGIIAINTIERKEKPTDKSHTPFFREQLPPEVFKKLLNDPRIVKAIDFARKNDIPTDFFFPKMDSDNSRASFKRLEGFNNIQNLQINSPALEALESDEFRSFIKDPKYVQIIDPPLGFRKDKFPDNIINLNFIYATALPVQKLDMESEDEEAIKVSAYKYYDLDEGEVKIVSSEQEFLDMHYRHFYAKVMERRNLPHLNAIRHSFNEGERDEAYYSGQGARDLYVKAEQMVLDNLESFNDVDRIMFAFYDYDKEKYNKIIRMLKFAYELTEKEDISISVQINDDRIHPQETIDRITAIEGIGDVETIIQENHYNPGVRLLKFQISIDDGNIQGAIDKLFSILEQSKDAIDSKYTATEYGYFVQYNKEYDAKSIDITMWSQEGPSTDHAVK